MNSFKLFRFKRKLEVFSSAEGFFELHSIAMERKKDKRRAENSNFLATLKSLNEFKMLYWRKFVKQRTNFYICQKH